VSELLAGRSRRWLGRTLGLLAATLALGCASEESTGTGNAKDDGRIRLVMIPKDTQMSFWNQVRDGAERAAKEFDIDLQWKGPSKGNDIAAQKQVLQQFMDGSVDGILLAPTDSVSFSKDARTAMAKGTPVLIFDSAIEGKAGEEFITFVATDNEAAGKLGGAHLMKLVGEGAKTVLFRHQEGHASTGAREEGALSEMKAAKADVLVENRYSGPTMDEAQKTALNMVDQLTAAAGVFASNQTSAEGLLAALRKLNLAGKVKVVGFDQSELLVDGLKDGSIDALVVQDPVDMGYQSVKLMIQHLKDKDANLEPVIQTGVHLVTRENMDEPEIAALLK
jgi:ribose transport system substrate-binding protein